MNRPKIAAKDMNFETMSSTAVPRDRKGKHNWLLLRIFDDLKKVGPGVALKVPVSSLGSQKIQNIRAALTREVKKRGLTVQTAFDDDYFYVWRSNR